MHSESFFAPRPSDHSKKERMLVGIREAARLLSISDRTLFTLTKAGKVPHVRINRRVLYRPDSLQEWLSAREKGGVDVAP